MKLNARSPWFVAPIAATVATITASAMFMAANHASAPATATTHIVQNADATTSDTTTDTTTTDTTTDTATPAPVVTTPTPAPTAAPTAVPTPATTADPVVLPPCQGNRTGYQCVTTSSSSTTAPATPAPASPDCDSFTALSQSNSDAYVTSSFTSRQGCNVLRVGSALSGPYTATLVGQNGSPITDQNGKTIVISGANAGVQTFQVVVYDAHFAFDRGMSAPPSIHISVTGDGVP